MIARGPCTLWPTTNGHGYGVIKAGKGRTTYVHIIAFVATFGEYDRALVLDHLCGHRACFDPNHLEPVTFAENARRGQKRRWARTRDEPDPFYDPSPLTEEEYMERAVIPAVEDIVRWAPGIAQANALRAVS